MKKLLLITSIVVLMVGITACNEKSEDDVVSRDVSNQDINNDGQQDTLADDLNDEIKDTVSDISEKVNNGEMKDDEAEEEMMKAIQNSKVMQNEYDKQKELMPVYMKLAKEFRDCLSDASDLSDAKKCGDEAEERSQKLGLNNEDEYTDEEEVFGTWSSEEKEAFIKDLDKNFVEMEKTNKCFNESATFPEAMTCMQAIQ